MPPGIEELDSGGRTMRTPVHHGSLPHGVRLASAFLAPALLVPIIQTPASAARMIRIPFTTPN
jgi:hypothetical protein